jgi:hypothetical protein
MEKETIKAMESFETWIVTEIATAKANHKQAELSRHESDYTDIDALEDSVDAESRVTALQECAKKLWSLIKEEEGR